MDVNHMNPRANGFQIGGILFAIFVFGADMLVIANLIMDLLCLRMQFLESLAHLVLVFIFYILAFQALWHSIVTLQIARIFHRANLRLLQQLQEWLDQCVDQMVEIRAMIEALPAIIAKLYLLLLFANYFRISCSFVFHSTPYSAAAYFADLTLTLLISGILFHLFSNFGLDGSLLVIAYGGIVFVQICFWVARVYYDGEIIVNFRFVGNIILFLCAGGFGYSAIAHLGRTNPRRL